ncbi:MAG: aminotransferase class I/II-fold pyridoxal phosphate-dependent enzyme [Candidatus Micrarchaeia archaeon]
MAEYAERLKKLPPYLFAEMEQMKAEKKKQGVDLIPLGIGDPDLPTPEFVIESLTEEAKKDANHKYPTSQGEQDFKEAVATWMKKRFNVEVNPDTQVCASIGSKEAIANVSRAFVNPKDKVLCPDPAYPVYSQASTVFNDGEPILIPLKKENAFLPKLEDFENTGAKVLYLNYPNNPTGAIATKEFLRQTQEFAEKEDLAYCFDNAYSEFTFDDYKAPSALQFGEKVVEFHSLSKTFNMTGDRIGFTVGDEKIISGLKKVKSQVDSGPPIYIQKAAITALESYSGSQPPREVSENMKEYEERRNVLVEGLQKKGFDAVKPKATFYIWMPVAGKSTDFCKKLLDVGVVTTPGIGFGKNGEGFVRFALTQKTERIKEALERIEKKL